MDVKQMLTMMKRPAVEQWARERSQSHYVGMTEGKDPGDSPFPSAICRVLGKYLMFVDTSDLSVVPHLLLDGIWEPWITMAIAKHIKPGMFCIDGGSHVGYYAILMGDLTGPEGSVIGVEPQSSLVRCIERSASLNGMKGRVSAARGVLHRSESSSGLLLEKHQYLAGDARLVTERTEDVPDDEIYGEPPSYETPTMWEVDSFYSEKHGYPDFVKLDVEGCEHEALEGMKDTIAQRKPLTICVETKGSIRPFFEYRAHDFEIGRIKFDGTIEPLTETFESENDWEMLWLERK